MIDHYLRKYHFVHFLLLTTLPRWQNLVRRPFSVNLLHCKPVSRLSLLRHSVSSTFPPHKVRLPSFTRCRDYSSHGPYKVFVTLFTHADFGSLVTSLWPLSPLRCSTLCRTQRLVGSCPTFGTVAFLSIESFFVLVLILGRRCHYLNPFVLAIKYFVSSFCGLWTEWVVPPTSRRIWTSSSPKGQ